jgi:hypothetical protein
VATAAICLLGAAIAPATPASTTIAIATPKPSIPVSVSLLLSLPPLAPSLFFTRIGKPHTSIGIRQGQNPWVDLSMAKTATGGSRGEQRNTSLPLPLAMASSPLCGYGVYPLERSLAVDPPDRAASRDEAGTKGNVDSVVMRVIRRSRACPREGGGRMAVMSL